MSTRLAWWVPSEADGFYMTPQTRPEQVIHTATWPGVKACIHAPDERHHTVSREDVFDDEDSARLVLTGRMTRKLGELERECAAYRKAIEELANDEG